MKGPHARMRARMLNGYGVPRSMEWLLWPIGYRKWLDDVAAALEAARAEGKAGAVVPMAPGPFLPLAKLLREVGSNFWPQVNAIVAEDRATWDRIARRRR